MFTELWQTWMIAGVILIIIEIFTAGFFIICFGVAAIITGLFALTGLDLIGQFIIFIITSILTFLAVKPLYGRLTLTSNKGIGANRLIGEKALVIQEINRPAETGQIRVKSEVWRAQSADDQIIAVDTKVIVTAIDGVHAIVRVAENINKE